MTVSILALAAPRKRGRPVRGERVHDTVDAQALRELAVLQHCHFTRPMLRVLCQNLVQAGLCEHFIARTLQLRLRDVYELLAETLPDEPPSKAVSRRKPRPVFRLSEAARESGDSTLTRARRMWLRGVHETAIAYRIGRKELREAEFPRQCPSGPCVTCYRHSRHQWRALPAMPLSYCAHYGVGFTEIGGRLCPRYMPEHEYRATVRGTAEPRTPFPQYFTFRRGSPIRLHWQRMEHEVRSSSQAGLQKVFRQICAR